MLFLQSDGKGRYEYSTGNEGQVIEFQIYYHLGGANLWSGVFDRRGLWASTTLVTYEKRDGYTSKTYTMALGTDGNRSGGKMFLKELPRKSDKELRLAAEYMDEFVGEIANNWMTNLQYAKALLLEKAELYKAKSIKKAA